MPDQSSRDPATAEPQTGQNITGYSVQTGARTV